MEDAGRAPVEGICDERFSAVRAAFVENFADRGELGGAVCVIHRGTVVVDLVGGWMDRSRTQPWSVDTITDFYSVGKALLSVLLLRLVDGGSVGLDDRVASSWPEFACGGKSGVTLRHVLTHRAGVPAIRPRLTDDELFDWEAMTGALAATEPWWPPGEQLAYHVNTFGHLVGELVHRISGAMPGEALAAVAGSLGADVWFGVPEREQHRCATTIWDPAFAIPPFDLEHLDGIHLLNALAHFNPPGYSSVGLVNTRRWRSLQLGSTSGHGSANGVARIYDALLDADRLLSEELRDEAVSVQATGRCPILDDDLSYGLGFTTTTARRPLGPNPGAFGHFGTGGSLGFADPVDGIAFGYVMNHVVPRWQSSRNRALIDAVYASLRGR
ncbi:MAG: beta-lactamase family protein [Actinobacteria bacterium]|nr:beta-lactamase family protein [Actinomycetota bacterium]